MNKDDVYRRLNSGDGDFIWCRLLYVGKRNMGGITLNGRKKNSWIWIMDKDNMEDWELVSEIPEDIRDRLFDPFVEIEFAKEVVRKGKDID